MKRKLLNMKYPIVVGVVVAYTVTKQKVDNSDPIPYSCFASAAADAYSYQSSVVM